MSGHGKKREDPLRKGQDRRKKGPSMEAEVQGGQEILGGVMAGEIGGLQWRRQGSI